METPTIYVADLAAYNNSISRGVWIDATNEPDDINNEIKVMLSKSPIANAEEYAIHGYEGFCGCELGESAGIDNVHSVACFIDESGEVAGRLLASFLGDLEQAKTAFSDHYAGCFESISGFAENFSDQAGEIPSSLRPYIDFEAMGNDMGIFTIETGYQEVHVFWNH